MLRIPDRHLPCRASPVTATQRKDILPTRQLAPLAESYQTQLAPLAERHQRQLAPLAESPLPDAPTDSTAPDTPLCIPGARASPLHPKRKAVFWSLHSTDSGQIFAVPGFARHRNATQRYSTANRNQPHPPTQPAGQALAYCNRVGCNTSQSEVLQLHPFAGLVLCPSYILRIPNFLLSCTGWTFLPILIVCPFAFVWLLLFGRWSFAPSPVWANPTCALLGAYRLEHLSISLCGLTKKAKKKQHNIHYVTPRRQAPRGYIMYIIFHFFAQR